MIIMVFFWYTLKNWEGVRPPSCPPVWDMPVFCVFQHFNNFMAISINVLIDFEKIQTVTKQIYARKFVKTKRYEKQEWGRVFIFITWYKGEPAWTHALEGPHLTIFSDSNICHFWIFQRFSQRWLQIPSSRKNFHRASKFLKFWMLSRKSTLDLWILTKFFFDELKSVLESKAVQYILN